MSVMLSVGLHCTTHKPNPFSPTQNTHKKPSGLALVLSLDAFVAVVLLVAKTGTKAFGLSVTVAYFVLVPVYLSKEDEKKKKKKNKSPLERAFHLRRNVCYE